MMMNNQSVELLTVMGHYSNTQWVVDLSYVAGSGVVQLCLILSSLLWLSFDFLRFTAPGSRKLDAVSVGPSVSFEICGQVTRAAAFVCSIFGVVADVRQWPNTAVVGYIFCLGMIRLADQRHWRRMVLQQVNLLTAATMILMMIANFLPLVVRSILWRPHPTIVVTIASLGLSVLVALTTPRQGVLLKERGVQDRLGSSSTLEETCSPLSYYFTFGWLTPLIWKGCRQLVMLEDLPGLPSYDDPKLLLSLITEARNKSGSTLRTLLQFVRAELLVMAGFISVSFAVELVAPYAMYQLLAYLADPGNAVYDPAVWLILMFAGPMVKSVTLQQYTFQSARVSVRVKSAMTAELYQRAMGSMELESGALSGITQGSRGPQKITSGGQLANLMSSDIDAIINAREIIMVAVGVPVGVILAIFGLYKVVGWSSLVGIAIMIICSPLPAKIIRNVSNEQEQAREAQDIRISLATEYLGAIRTIKYFAWEDITMKHIQDARNREQKHLWRIDVLYALMSEATEFIPILTLLVIFTVHVGILKQPLTAAIAFTTVSLVVTIRRNLYMVSAISSRVTNALISMGRLDKYFAATTTLITYTAGPLRIEEATFRRSKTASFRLRNVTIDFVEGGLNVVTGPSGSGKTSLLLAILGETVLESGQVTRPEDVAFASQSAWLQSLSIRDNILFNSPYDETRYDSVLEACCLRADLDGLPDRDQTQVGENGTFLSGGQRARVALARALYSQAPLLLLDDIFSTVDTKTALSIWNKVFCGDMVKDRTIVLISQLTWLPTQADLVIHIEAGAVETIEQNLGIIRKPITVPSYVDVDTNSGTVETSDESCGITSEAGTEATQAAKPTDIEDEMGGTGASTRLLLFKYIMHFGGPAQAALALLGLVLLNLAGLATTLWLSHWVDTYDGPEAVNISYYLGVYVAVNIASSVIECMATLGFARGAWVAAKKLHAGLVGSVLSVSLSWWMNIPVGRVVNRLSRDMDSLDQMLGYQVFGFLSECAKILFRIGAVSSIFPIFIIPSAVCCMIGMVFGEMYTRTAVILTRLVASSRSPMFSQFSESLTGLTVIRARSGMVEKFNDKLAERLRAFSLASKANSNCNCWVRLRIDLVTALVTVFAAWIAVSKAGVLAAGLVGFSLTNATGLSNAILNVVRMMNDLEVELQSFDRVQEYTQLPSEITEMPQATDSARYVDDEDSIIPANWPRSGKIEFRDVTVRYDLGGPDILKDVNLRFEAGERVAIVGRTGSGKSTLVLSLLRFTHIVSGKILYDDVDITSVPRRKLRQALTIIPQEATLFSGTVGSNLDPSESTDELILEQALASCAQIASFQVFEDEMSSYPGISLSTSVQQSGSNFSHGQRQVLAFCRSLVRKSKLMLLDEATASMDHATDAGIQSVLRRELNGDEDRNLITIAHRLRTVVDYDKVVVMGSGRVLEVGSPGQLLQRRGVLYDMMMHCGDGEELDMATI